MLLCDFSKFLNCQVTKRTLLCLITTRRSTLVSVVMGTKEISAMYWIPAHHIHVEIMAIVCMIQKFNVGIIATVQQVGTINSYNYPPMSPSSIL